MTPAPRALRLVAAAALTSLALAACGSQTDTGAGSSSTGPTESASAAGWSPATDAPVATTVEAESTTAVETTTSDPAPTSSSGPEAEDAADAPTEVTTAAPDATEDDPNATATAVPTTTATAPVARVMDTGTEGEDVRTLQQALEEKKFWIPGADGHYGALTKQAVYAAQKVYGLNKDGLAGPKTMKALDQEVDLKPATTSGKAVEIDVDKQLLMLVEDGEVIAILNTSTGNGEKFTSEGIEYRATTPAGSFKIQSNNKWDWVEGPLGKMYKPAFFNGGIAFHGSTEIPPFPASHGCARLSKSAQDMLWEKGFAQVGTRVVVR